MMQSRFKSPVVWAAVLAQLVTILLTIGVIGDVLGETLSQVGAGVLQLLVIFGVLNNPTDEGHF